MKTALAFVAMLLLPSIAPAKVLNVEFKFTPFTGDPAKSDEVVTVPGKARVFLNNVPLEEQEVRRQEVPVLFEEREIAAAVWVPVESLGSLVRKGRNTIRIEFEPADGKAEYRADLRWASVTDQTTTTGGAGRGTTTNQSGEGVETKKAKGKVVFEREFDAPFAADQPWHHYAEVRALSDEDRKQIEALVAKRLDAFKPDFAGLYALLKGRGGLDVASIRSAKCVDKASAAGIRIVAAKNLDIATTGGSAVIVQAKKGALYSPENPSALEKIKGDDMQICASTALFVAYPPRLVVVRSPSGAWEAVQ